MVENGEEMRRD